MPDLIYINGRFLTQQVTGVQRYALELFRHMDALLNEPAYNNTRLVCLTPRGIGMRPAWKNIQVRQVGRNRDNAWEQLDLPFYARGGLLFSPGNTGPLFFARQVITLHDASTFAVPVAYSRFFRLKYWFTFHVLGRLARLVLTDSLYSQQELARFLGLPPERFKVVLLGGDHLRDTEADDRILARRGLVSQAFFLSVASQSAHKNFALILRAAARLDESVQFAAAGGSFARVFQQGQALSMPANVHLLGYVNDQELKALYQNALGFIFPSIYEGFGLPVLEAMSCGCPVFCSRASSLPQVAGQAVEYIDPFDDVALVSTLKRFQADTALQDDLRSRGFEHARSFTWDKTAQETLDALLSCA